MSLAYKYHLINKYKTPTLDSLNSMMFYYMDENDGVVYDLKMCKIYEMEVLGEELSSRQRQVDLNILNMPKIVLGFVEHESKQIRQKNKNHEDWVNSDLEFKLNTLSYLLALRLGDDAKMMKYLQKICLNATTLSVWDIPQRFHDMSINELNVCIRSWGDDYFGIKYL